MVRVALSGDGHSVKSRLLPLAPLDAALESWVERLPRQLLKGRLVPVSDIVVIDESAGEYKAVGKNPCFELKLDEIPTEGFWYYMEGALACSNGSREGSLRVDVAGQDAAAVCVPISTNLRGSIREVFWLPAGVTALHWFPTQDVGFFSQSPLLIHRISRVESVSRRLHRVMQMWRQLGSDSRENARAVRFWNLITNLQQSYSLTTALRIQKWRRIDYPAFVERQAMVDRRELPQLCRAAARLQPGPVISLVIPVLEQDLQWLDAAVASVESQLYPHWELYLVCGASMSAQVTAAIARVSRAPDTRIRQIELVGSCGLSDLFNHAMDRAGGSLLALLGQHDLLHSSALLNVALEDTAKGSADIIYCDEDSVDGFGQRLSPIFKPDWNPDMFLSCNYLGRLVFFRTTLVRQFDGFRPGFDGAETYDLTLRMLRQAPDLRIRHLAKALYSLRRPDAVASTKVVEAEASDFANLRALREHLEPQGATVSRGLFPASYAVTYGLPDPKPLVSLIIPTRDRVEILRTCVKSILSRTDYAPWELLIIDNGSRNPDTLAFLREVNQHPQIRVVAHDAPFNYPKLNNLGAHLARGEVLGLLNNDLEVISTNWLTEMVSHALRPDIGAVGAKLLYPDGSVQHAGVVLGIGGVAAHVHRFLPGDAPGYCQRASIVHNLSAVTGACMLVRKSLYWEVGGMNEASLAVAFNDIDFCLKLRKAGYRNLFTPRAMLYHHESLSRGRDDTPAKMDTYRREFCYMQEAWGDALRDDPAYNRNLTREFEDFSLATAQ